MQLDPILGTQVEKNIIHHYVYLIKKQHVDIGHRSKALTPKKMDRHPRHTCASDFGISDRTIVDGFDGVRFVMAVPGHSLRFLLFGGH
jgi:hypothetical protein